ncbi:MAG: hypothetical protein HY293_20460 [Planctomycetes bacterium]|nr:hypothetical protein [Planctomycetota bacterium]
MFIKEIARGAGAAFLAVAATAVLLPHFPGYLGDLLILGAWPLVALTAYVVTLALCPDPRLDERK